MAQKTIGDFQLVEKLTSNYKYTKYKCNIYKAVNKKNSKLYIVREIPNNSLNYNVKEKLINLIDSLSKLNSDNIVKIKCKMTSNNNTYIISEFTNGSSLSTFLGFFYGNNKKPLSEIFIQKAIRQIISGIEFIKDNNNILLKDITLFNIFLNFDEHENKIKNGKMPPRINYSDIKLDKEAISLKIGIFNPKTIEMIESGFGPMIAWDPLYSPPETAKSKGSILAKSQDIKQYIWMLGIITYILLIGREPFRGKTKEEVKNKVIEGKYTLPKKLQASVEIIKFISELLQYDPDKRSDLSKIKEHPFLKNKVETFQFIELDENIEVDARDSHKALKSILINEGEFDEREFRQENSLVGELRKKIEEENKKIETIKKETENIKKETKLIDEENAEKDRKLKELEINKLKEEIMKLRMDNENKIKEYEKKLNETKNLTHEF
jgi:serine/threonine protein kinase